MPPPGVVYKKTGPTVHHCPGAKGWVGDISPGGCWRPKGYPCCYKHSMICRNGCLNGHHLRNQDGCQECVARIQAEARRERKAKEQEGKLKEAQEADTFWNPGPERKKPKKRGA
ncbi:hypothetical protein ACN47E_001632 [Coniothyrium glycines]